MLYSAASFHSLVCLYVCVCVFTKCSLAVRAVHISTMTEYPFYHDQRFLSA